MADDGEDRISNLPRHLTHHILSFLPMDDIVRMRCLSKHWKIMWRCVPVLNFEEFTDADFAQRTRDLYLGPFINMLNIRERRHQKMFVKIVDNILDTRRERFSDEESNVTRFKLYLNSLYGGSVPAAKIDTWLNCAVTMRVKELNLCIEPWLEGPPLYRVYRFPHSALNNARSITLLTLEGIKLKISFPISLPNLTTLSLTKVILENETFKNLVSGSPILEDLHLSGYKKGEFGVYGCSLSGVDLTVCVTLRSLSLHLSKFTYQWLEHITFGLPQLERLTLDCCCGFQNFSIHSQSLKSLYFLGLDSDDWGDIGDGDTKVALNTPNLVYFKYRGYMSFRFLINSANLLEANLILWEYDEESLYLDLLSLLSNLNCSSSTTMWLHVDHEEVLLIPEVIREMSFSPLPGLKHLSVRIHKDKDFSRNQELREALIWCAPSVETLDIGSCSCKLIC